MVAVTGATNGCRRYVLAWWQSVMVGSQAPITVAHKNFHIMSDVASDYR